MKRFYGMIIALIGVAILAMGIVFEFQAATAKQKVADELSSPVTLSNLNATYDQVKAGYTQRANAEEPAIKTGTQPSTMYDYLSAQRALLGLAKSNIETAKFVMMSGTVDIVLGVGLILTGMVLYMKPAA